jgi:phosphonoacetaldehyde hydrolase
MWTIGVTKTGNELGLSKAEAEALSSDAIQAKLDVAQRRMATAGAHYVVEGVWQIPDVLDQINQRLADGALP